MNMNMNMNKVVALGGILLMVLWIAFTILFSLAELPVSIAELLSAIIVFGGFCVGYLLTH